MIATHQKDVYRWAYTVVGNRDDALDVVQDVYLRWVERGRDVELEHPRAWLRVTAINRAIDVVRRRRVRAEHRPAAEPASDASPLETLGRAQTRSEVVAAMDGLTDMQRAVLVAKVHDGLTFASIASEHGIATGTAKTHYLRALAAIREGFERGASDE